MTSSRLATTRLERRRFLIDLFPPPTIPVLWIVTARGKTVMSTPCQTAFAAVASVAKELGNPHFSECEVQMMDGDEVPK
jgi:hypothetical protein